MAVIKRGFHRQTTQFIDDGFLPLEDQIFQVACRIMIADVDEEVAEGHRSRSRIGPMSTHNNTSMHVNKIISSLI